MTTATITPARLRAADLARLASVGLRTRKLRAGLSGLGIAIGVAAIVAVLGLSASSSAGLLAEISKLGTNLLTVTNGQSVTGGPVELPGAAPAMIARLPGVTNVQDTGITTASAYRSPLIPAADTSALSVQAASLGLPRAVGTSVARGRYLNAATAREPVAVLGAAAAQRLGIDRIWPGERIWAGGQWFYVAGILRPAVLAPEIDASVLVGYPAAGKYLGFDGHPSAVYLRARTSQVQTVDTRLAGQANPEDPSEVNVSQPSSALAAEADAKGAFDTLFLGLGAVVLLVGAVGVTNIMVISVLERRSEIGLRRALGATRGHIRTQFLAEAILLALGGGVAGVALGAAATDLRPRQRLGRRGAPAGLGRRARRRVAHRRRRRPAASPARRPHVLHPGALDHLTGQARNPVWDPSHHHRACGPVLVQSDPASPASCPEHWTMAPPTAPRPLLGYPVETVLAEKLTTAITLGPANTWVRDYADIQRRPRAPGSGHYLRTVGRVFRHVFGMARMRCLKRHAARSIYRPMKQASSAVKHRPADFAAQSLIVKHKLANLLRKLVTLPPALTSTCGLTVAFWHGSTGGFDRIGGSTKLMRGDVRDGPSLARSVCSMPGSPSQVPCRAHGMTARRASLHHLDLPTHPSAGMLDRLTRS